jgi:preprotein translocase subunit SecY
MRSESQNSEAYSAHLSFWPFIASALISLHPESIAKRWHFQQTQGTLLGFFDMFSGRTESSDDLRFGNYAYISASIILELLTVVVPTWRS